MTEYISKNIISSIVEEKDCTGCSACVNICAKSAIQMRQNEVGHILPYIDADNCVGCGLCQIVCPSLHPVKKNPPQDVYAAWATDDFEHTTSTSGGVASVLSRQIVSDGGIVYGCSSQAKGVIKHVRVDSDEKINCLKGSKYVQSDINYIYKDVKVDLINNLRVIFFGTPCQIAGLKSFLKKDYDNLFLVDLICHGVPSQKILFDHLESKGIKRDAIDSISFRDGGKYSLKAYSGGNLVYSKGGFDDLYLSAFNDCLFNRESCVNCKYSTPDRCGDITVGDFRMLGKSVPFTEKTNGNVSLVLVNTSKGVDLLASCRESLQLRPRELKEALDGNPQLSTSARRRGDYYLFQNLYLSKGIDYALRKCLRIRRIKNSLLKAYTKFSK